MVFFRKPGHFPNFPSKLEDHRLNSEALSTSLRDFRSKILYYVSQTFYKHDHGSNSLSLRYLHKCFDLIKTSQKSFEKLVLEIDYPMNKWGVKSIDYYLNYSLNFLNLLNAITSSVNHINQAKISNLHALTRLHTSPQKFKKIPPRNIGKDFKVEMKEGKWLLGIQEKSCDEEENVILEALMVVKGIGLCALGLVLSGLCSDTKPYIEVRSKFAGGFEDSIVKDLDFEIGKNVIEFRGVVKEVSDVNCAIERISIEELKRSLEVLEISIDGIEKELNSMFSEVLATRNQLLDNFRITTQKRDSVSKNGLLKCK